MTVLRKVQAYAGIGSRSISSDEYGLITEAAAVLARLGWVAYSGNGDGSDIGFQRGSGGRCVLMLPWHRFNAEHYEMSASLQAIDAGNTAAGNLAVTQFHPAPDRLSQGAQRMICRDYHQVVGFAPWPPVRFVLFCADESNGSVKGGTGQAVRVARSRGIPCLNLRDRTSEDVAGWLAGAGFIGVSDYVVDP